VAAELVGTLAAIRLRSDVERKRLAGMRPTDRPPSEAASAALYAESFTRRVYERLAALARTVLGAGRSVVVDAACTKRWQRDRLARVAAECESLLVWLEFDVPAEAVLARVAARGAAGTDPSDASADVVSRQATSREPIGDDELRGGAVLVRTVDENPADVARRLGVIAAVAYSDDRAAAGEPPFGKGISSGVVS
jgi:predicted kinase